MATDKEFIEYLMEQINTDNDVTYKKMFGEYGVYYKGKIVLLVCDNQVFVKPTDAGRAFLSTVVEAPPYKGAKNSFLIENIDDGERLLRLIEITADALPEPKPKKTKKNIEQR